jgi:hypothetical protein
MALQRYTLSLPAEVYKELEKLAEQRSVTTNEVVRQCLKFGLVAMKIDGDPATELFVKEKVPRAGDHNTVDIKETRLQFVW